MELQLSYSNLLENVYVILVHDVVQQSEIGNMILIKFISDSVHVLCVYFRHYIKRFKLCNGTEIAFQRKYNIL